MQTQKYRYFTNSKFFNDYRYVLFTTRCLKTILFNPNRSLDFCSFSLMIATSFYPSRMKSRASSISAFVAVWLMRMSPMPPSRVKLIVPEVFFLSCVMSSNSSA